MEKMEEKKKRTWEERSRKGCLEFCAGDGLRVDHCLPHKATLRNSELFPLLPAASSPPVDTQFIASRDKIE